MGSLLIESRDLETGGRLAIWSLNRPDALNAFSMALIAELEGAVWSHKNDPKIRALIVTGIGRAFSTGADLKERAAMSPEDVGNFLDRVGAMFSQIESSPFPVISAINGFALGGGLELALACDFRIAAEEAQIGLTETSLGIIPGAGGTQRLARIAGTSTAKELILTARRISGREACSRGIVGWSVPHSDVMPRAMALATEIAANAPVAVRQAKFAVDQGAGLGLKDGLALERKAYELTLGTRDRLEALAAFREKRRPEFRGE